MHETSVAQRMVDTAIEVADQNGGGRVVGMRLLLGEMTCVEPDTLSFAFGVVSRGTRVEGCRWKSCACPPACAAAHAAPSAAATFWNHASAACLAARCWLAVSCGLTPSTSTRRRPCPQENNHEQRDRSGPRRFAGQHPERRDQPAALRPRGRVRGESHVRAGRRQDHSAGTHRRGAGQARAHGGHHRRHRDHARRGSHRPPRGARVADQHRRRLPHRSASDRARRRRSARLENWICSSSRTWAIWCARPSSIWASTTR